LRKKIPSRLAVHLPIVYISFHDEEENLYGAVVEMLEPLDPHLQSILYGYTPRLSSQIIPILKNKEFITNLVNTIVKHYADEELNSKARNSIIINVSKYLLDVDYSKGTIHQAQKKALDVLRYKVIEAVYKAQPDYKDRSYKNLHDISSKIASKYLAISNDQSVFPESAEEKVEAGIAKKIPGAKSLIELLELLRDKYNIEWADLHGNNIMHRPGTRDIVISDPGMFQFYEEIKENTIPKSKVGDLHFHKPGNVPEPDVRPGMKKHLKNLNSKGFDVKVPSDKYEDATDKNLLMNEPGKIVEPDVRKSIKKYFKSMKLSK
jgi:hypothetical protein